MHLIKGQAYRAKRKAINLVEGTDEEQYSKLRSYGLKLLKGNKGSTIAIWTSRLRPQSLPKF